jgi:hypothetical protein
MKKTYKTPQVEVIRIQTAGMLAVSGELNPGSTPITNPGEVGARELYWYDED